MALNPKLSVAGRNLALDTVAALLNGGFLDIYDGTQPSDPSVAITTQVRLSRVTFGNPAFSASSSGVATANAITDDLSAAATGTASWYRCMKSDGVTAVMDGSAATSAANLNLTTVNIVAGARVSISSMSISMAAG